MIVATADTDIAANGATGDGDGVQPKTGHQVANDLAARHIKNVVVQLHINTANTPTGHCGHIAVLKSADNSPAGHQEGVATITLCQRLDLASRHDEVIYARALADRPINKTGVNRDLVSTGAERYRACDGARTVGGQAKAIVALQVSE